MDIISKRVVIRNISCTSCESQLSINQDDVKVKPDNNPMVSMDIYYVECPVCYTRVQLKDVPTWVMNKARVTYDLTNG